MNTIHIIQTLIEIALALFVVWCFINEKRLIKWEIRTKRRIGIWKAKTSRKIKLRLQPAVMWIDSNIFKNTPEPQPKRILTEGREQA